MRIVGGKHRGRRLAVPPGDRVRPTGERAREALFDILTHAGLGPGGTSPVAGARVLDAFCGTGAFGLEALSRGAAHAVLLDVDLESLRFARDNAAILGETDNVTVRRLDPARAGRADAPATLAFLDPPYASDLAVPALTALRDGGWFAPDAVVVVELPAKKPFAPPPGFAVIDERRYGAARLVFLRAAPAD